MVFLSHMVMPSEGRISTSTCNQGKLVSSIRSNDELFTWNILLTKYCILLLWLNLVPFDCSYVKLLTDLVIEWETYRFVLNFICILEGYIYICLFLRLVLACYFTN